MVNNEDGSQADNVKYDNLLDYFSLYLFPLAIRVGMTPYEFWECDPDWLWGYLDAYEMKQKEQALYDNAIAYAQGVYFMYAIGQAFAEKGKSVYPKEPLKLFESEQKDTKKSNDDKWKTYIMSTLKVKEKKK